MTFSLPSPSPSPLLKLPNDDDDGNHDDDDDGDGDGRTYVGSSNDQLYIKMTNNYHYREYL